MDKKKLDRISELSRKSRVEPLSAEELAEQKALRDEYIALVRKNFRATLDSIEYTE